MSPKKEDFNPDEVALNETEVNPNDPAARKIREDAVAYAEAVSNGEEPWNEDADKGFDTPRSERKASEEVDTAAPAETETPS